MTPEAAMMPVTLDQVAEAVGGELHIPAHARSPHETFEPSVVSDSRQAHDDSIFVAIPGERVDGHDFVAQVAGQGAAAAIVQHPV